VGSLCFVDVHASVLLSWKVTQDQNV